MKINSICIKTIFLKKKFLDFFDEDRIFDEVAFLKSLPSNKFNWCCSKNKK